MKVRIVVIVALISVSAFGQQQDTCTTLSKKVKLFSISPIHSEVSEVNGLVLGAGHYKNRKINDQKINGLNVDVIHPAPLLLMSFGLDIPFRSVVLGLTYKESSDIHFLDKNDFDNTFLTMNGLNISVGGFYEGVNFSGVNISIISGTNRLNGVSIAPVINGSGIANGIQVSALANISIKGNGVQLAVSNVAEKFNGIQIGIFNKSKDQRGIQLGLWNRNGKRSLPFINWQFKS